jgi:hypothetical protein
VVFIGSSVIKPFGFSAPALRMLQQDDAPMAQTGSVPAWLLARLSDFAVLLLIGGLILWLRPALVEQAAEGLRRRPVVAAGLGLVALVLASNGVVIAILLAVLLLVVGIWLGAVTLWQIAFLLWAIGYPALVFILAVFALLVLYGSKVVVADMVGRLILKRLAPDALAAERRILPLVLGLVLYVLLRSIPLLGGAIEVIVTIFGLGAMWVALRQRRRKAAEIAPLGSDDRASFASTPALEMS